MRIAICPGSYNPVTRGHLNIIERSAALFDKVIAVVSFNADKKYAFSAEERVQMLREVTGHLPNVEVDAYMGLVAEYARLKKASALVKGLRAVSDFEYEFQMALINKKLNPELETIFINTEMRFMYLSSSAVREIASFGGDLSAFIPPQIVAGIEERLRRPSSEIEGS
ncbi:MAG: pantetheine-phosphate adenylyltransferase [Oscillospiraceae bacterium]